jgi:hypothetical protein
MKVINEYFKLKEAEIIIFENKKEEENSDLNVDKYSNETNKYVEYISKESKELYGYYIKFREILDSTLYMYFSDNIEKYEEIVKKIEKKEEKYNIRYAIEDDRRLYITNRIYFLSKEIIKKLEKKDINLFMKKVIEDDLLSYIEVEDLESRKEKKIKNFYSFYFLDHLAKLDKKVYLLLKKARLYSINEENYDRHNIYLKDYVFLDLKGLVDFELCFYYYICDFMYNMIKKVERIIKNKYDEKELINNFLFKLEIGLEYICFKKTSFAFITYDSFLFVFEKLVCKFLDKFIFNILIFQEQLILNFEMFINSKLDKDYKKSKERIYVEEENNKIEFDLTKNNEEYKDNIRKFRFKYCDEVNFKLGFEESKGLDKD